MNSSDKPENPSDPVFRSNVMPLAAWVAQSYPEYISIASSATIINDGEVILTTKTGRSFSLGFEFCGTLDYARFTYLGDGEICHAWFVGSVGEIAELKLLESQLSELNEEFTNRLSNMGGAE